MTDIPTVGALRKFLRGRKPTDPVVAALDGETHFLVEATEEVDHDGDTRVVLSIGSVEEEQ